MILQFFRFILLLGLAGPGLAAEEPTPAPPPDLEPGLIVVAVAAGGPAAQAGVQAGDVLLSYDGVPLLFVSSLAQAEEQARRVGQETVPIEVRRGGERLTLLVAVAGRLGVNLRPPLPPTAQAAYEQSLATDDPTAQAAAMQRAAAEAEAANDARAAAWLWEQLYRMAPAGSAEERRGAEGLTAQAARAGDALGEAAGWHGQGWTAQQRNDLKAARDFYQRALALRERLIPESLEVAKSLTNLGHVVRNQGDLAAAREYLQRALAIFERLAPERLDMATGLDNLGHVVRNQGDLAAAREYHQRALALRERLAPDSLDVAESLHNLAVVQDDLNEAKGYYQRALAIQERLAPDSLAVASSLTGLGAVAHTQGDLAGAKAYYQRALAIQERLAPEGLDMARSLNNLGTVAGQQSDFTAAKQFFERALVVYERLAPDHPNVATLWRNLGHIARHQGDLAGARVLYQRALEVREKLAPDSLATAESLNDLGTVAYEEGDLAKSRELYERALAIRQREAPGGLSVAGSLGNLGNVAYNEGDLARAKDLYQQALAIQERIAPESLIVAAALQNLGNVTADQGDLVAGKGLHQRALAIRERLVPDSLDVAASLNNLGNLASAEGEPAEAEALYQRALAISERQAPESLAAADTLGNLGNLAREQGHLIQAKGFYQQALAIQERLAPDSLTVALTWSNLGVVAYDRGHLAEAKDLLQRALAIQERLAPDSLEVARSLINLGSLARDQEDLATATAFYRRASDIARRRGGPDLLWRALYGLGRTQQQAQDPEAALAAFREAVEALESIRFTATETRERVLAGEAGDVYSDLIQLLLQLGRPEEALQYLERAKSKAVVDTLNLYSLRTRDEALTQLLHQFADLQAHLRAQQQALAEEQDKPADQQSAIKIAQLTQLLAGTKATFFQTLDRLRREYGEEYTRLVRVEAPDFTALRAVLPPGALLVEYFPAPDQLYLFVLTRDRFLIKSRAVRREDLYGRIREVRRRMTDFEAQRDPAGQFLRDTLASLYADLLAPVEEEWTPGTVLLVVPSGLLYYLPFGALWRPDGAGGGRYVAVRDRPLAVLTEVSVLGDLLRNNAAARGERNLGVLAFGNPAEVTPPLPGTEREVQHIVEAYPDSRSFLGPEATEWRAKMQAPFGRILHFATPGRLDHADPNRSYMALAAGEGEDGRLTEGEIFGLTLEGTQLVVLSACQTAVAEEQPGREVTSLARAFAIAGAPALVASLWKVDDAATATLMKAFYEALAAGQPKAQALQSAQAVVREREGWAHPFYWAGFELLGAWE